MSYFLCYRTNCLRNNPNYFLFLLKTLKQIMPPNTLKTNENPLSYSTLDALDGKIDSPTIVVRLIQSWEVRDFKRNNLLLSVDCLL